MALSYPTKLGAMFIASVLVAMLSACGKPPPPYETIAVNHCRAVLGWMSRKAGRPNVVAVNNNAVSGLRIIDINYELLETRKVSENGRGKSKRIFLGRISCSYPPPKPGLIVKSMRSMRAGTVILNGRKLSAKQVHSLNTYVTLLGG